jgi:hypothetical protein
MKPGAVSEAAVDVVGLLGSAARVEAASIERNMLSGASGNGPRMA